MLSLQEISDRLEIQDLMVHYSHAVDTRDWAALTDVFAEGAVIDYTAMGGPRGGLKEITEFLDSAMGMFPAFQHLIANSSVMVDGDTATGRTMCHNPMVVPDEDGTQKVLFCGLWYLDTFIRTDGGWRISERVEEKSYMYVTPPTPAF